MSGDLQNFDREPPPSRWIPFSDMLPLDYWAGVQWGGNYHARLELDKGAVESICRQNDLPPIVIKSDRWDPPSVREPEMVGPGVAAFKKVSLEPARRDIEYSHESPLVHIEPSPIQQQYGPKSIPIGWDMKIRDQTIVHDFELAHPNSDNKQTEKHFTTMLDSAIKTSLFRIGLMEWLTLRAGDPLHSTVQFVPYILIEYFALALGPNSVSDIRSIFFNDTQKRSVLDSLIGPGSVQNIAASRIEGYRAEGDKKRSRDFTNRVSNAWRRSNFPARYQTEPHGPTIMRRMSHRMIPGVLIAEPLLRLMDTLWWQHRAPLIRLSEK